MASLFYLWKHRAKFSFGSNQFYKAWGKRLFSFPSLLKRNFKRSGFIRKGAIIDELAELGDITVQGPYRFLTIGKQSFLGKVTIALHDEVIIGKRVCINDGVEILTASHDVRDPLWRHIKRKVEIEDYVWIGTGAMILPGVKLGRGCVVAARAVVTKSVKSNAIVAGNPAKPILKTRVLELNYNPCEFVAANRAWLLG